MQAILSITNVSKTFETTKGCLNVVSDVSFSMSEGSIRTPSRGCNNSASASANVGCFDRLEINASSRVSLCAVSVSGLKSRR